MIMKLKADSFKFDLVVFEKDEELFEKYLKRDKAFGLSREEAEIYPDTATDAYIAGLTNIDAKTKKPFVFINYTRYLDAGEALFVHELFHLVMIRYNWDMKEIVEKEEEVATFQEKCFNVIKDAMYKLLDSDEFLDSED